MRTIISLNITAMAKTKKMEVKRERQEENINTKLGYELEEDDVG